MHFFFYHKILMTTIFILICIWTLTNAIRLPKPLKKLFLNDKPEQKEVYSIITWDQGEILWDDANGTIINDLDDDILLAQQFDSHDAVLYHIKNQSEINTAMEQFVNENSNIVNLFKENVVNLDNILDHIAQDVTDAETTISLLCTYSLLLHMENKDTRSISISKMNASDKFIKQKIFKILTLSLLFFFKNPNYCS